MKHLLISLILLSLAVSGVAQTSKTKRKQTQDKSRHDHDEIKAMKIAYMTDFISLTPNESERFWPLYNKYWEEIRNLAKQRRVLYEKIEKEGADEKSLYQFFELDDKENAIKRRWAGEFQDVLSATKVAKVFVGDERFKYYLIRTHSKK